MITDPLADARDMFAAHTMFRREFGLMPGLVRAVTAADHQRAAVVVDHIALVVNVLQGHHLGEDEHIWPRLRERGTGEIASIVGVMADQHQVIHHGLLQVEEALTAWHDSASAETREALAVAIDQLLPVMKEHLALEEERVVPLIEKYLTDAEYALLAQEQGAGAPPDKLPTMFGMFMYETEPAVIDMVVSHLPAAVQPVIKHLGTQAYAAYAKEIYGTATPARSTD